MGDHSKIVSIILRASETQLPASAKAILVQTAIDRSVTVRDSLWQRHLLAVDSLSRLNSRFQHT